MTRTPTKPPDDKAMWKRVLKPHHPDLGGRHEDFVWLNHVRELVCSGLSEAKPFSTPPRPRAQPEPPGSPAKPDDCPRVPFAPGHDFEELTDRALRAARSNEGSVYGYVLSLLSDCRSSERMVFEERRGASYKRLAAIGHRVGMDLEERRQWYSLADSIPLSDRHAGHIIGKLKRRA